MGNRNPAKKLCRKEARGVFRDGNLFIMMVHEWGEFFSCILWMDFTTPCREMSQSPKYLHPEVGLVPGHPSRTTLLKQRSLDLTARCFPDVLSVVVLGCPVGS